MCLIWRGWTFLPAFLLHRRSNNEFHFLFNLEGFIFKFYPTRFDPWFWVKSHWLMHFCHVFHRYIYLTGQATVHNGAKDFLKSCIASYVSIKIWIIKSKQFVILVASNIIISVRSRFTETTPLLATSTQNNFNFKMMIHKLFIYLRGLIKLHKLSQPIV